MIRPFILLPLLIQAILAKPYGNFGFYSPYPPPQNQILYEFSPLEARGKSREQRDLKWREEFDDFLLPDADNMDKEPTCEQLREMWKIAKEFQRRATASEKSSRSSSGLISMRQQADLSSHERQQKSSFTSSSSSHGGLTAKDNLRADRRRLASPTGTLQKHHHHRQSGQLQDQSEADRGLSVRDPSKEIYGLIRHRVSEADQALSSPKANNVYGNVNSHSSGETSPKQRYLDIVRKELYGEDTDTSFQPSTDDGYAVLRYQESPSSARPLDKVRTLMLNEQSLKEEDNEEMGGSGVDPFDLIKQKLMSSSVGNARLSHGRGLLGAAGKSLRRIDQSKRRRHVSSKYFIPFIKILF